MKVGDGRRLKTCCYHWPGKMLIGPYCPLPMQRWLPLPTAKPTKKPVGRIRSSFHFVHSGSLPSVNLRSHPHRWRSRIEMHTLRIIFRNRYRYYSILYYGLSIIFNQTLLIINSSSIGYASGFLIIINCFVPPQIEDLGCTRSGLPRHACQPKSWNYAYPSKSEIIFNKSLKNIK